MKTFRIITLISAILWCGVNFTKAATITTIGDGNFNNPATWTGGVVPGVNDSAVILSDHSVSVTADDTVGSITIYSNVDGDRTILEIAIGITLTVNNTLYLFSDGANTLDEPETQVRLKGAMVVKGDVNFRTYSGAYPGLALLRMTYVNGYFTLHGDVNFYGAGGEIETLIANATTFKLAGSATQTLAVNTQIKYYHLIFANTSPGGVLLGSNINSSDVLGNVTVEAGKLDNNGYNIVGDNTRDFTIKDGATFIMSGTTALPSSYDHIIESNTTIQYAGSNQSVSNPNNGQNFEDLIIKGSGTKTLSSDILINGDLTLQSSTLDANQTFNYDIEIKGDWINSGGSFLARDGVVTFSGTSSITGAMAVSGTLCVPTGGTLTTNGNLTIQSGASLMHGVGTPGGGGTISGNVRVQRAGYSGSNTFNFWASPVTGASINSMGTSRYYYDPSLATGQDEDGLRAGWVSASGAMTSGLGYAITGGGTLSFTGTANNAPTGTPITVNVKKNVGASNDVGSNLIGNPFPSAMDADAFMTVNGPAGNNVITGALYFWDDDGSNGSTYATSDYAVWTGAGSVAGPNSSTDFDGYIASGQSFFVEKIADGTAQIEFRNSMRSTTNDAFFRKAPVERLWISITNDNNLYNETLIAFMPNATDSADALYDAKKMKGNEHIALYSKIDDEDYAIQALPLLTNDKTVNLGMDVLTGGVYSLNLKEIENIDESVGVLLEDTELGIFQNLRADPSYVFTLVPGNNIERFVLHFNSPINIETVSESCVGSDGEITLEQSGQYVWNYIMTNANGDLIQSSGSFNGVDNVAGLVEGDYSFAFVDRFGYQITKTVHLNSKEKVTAEFETSDNNISPFAEMQFMNTSAGATTYQWDFGDGASISTLKNPSHIYNGAGVYDVSLKASNEDCEDEFIQQVTVQQLSTGLPQFENDIDVFSNDRTIYIHKPEGAFEDASYAVYNLLGQALMQGVLNENSLDVIQLPGDFTGAVIVQIHHAAGIFDKKLFVSAH